MEDLEAGLPAAEAEAKRLEDLFENRLEGVLSSLGNAGITTEPVPGRVEWLEKATEELGARRAVVDSTRDRHDVAEVNEVLIRAEALLVDAGGEDTAPPDVWEMRLAELRLRLSDLEAVLVPVAREGRSALRASPSLLEAREEPSTAIGEELSSLVRMAQEERAASVGTLTPLERLQQDRQSLREAETARAKELAALEESLPKRAGQLNELAQLLRTARDLAEGDVCPVCDRDYQELGASSLGDHLEQQLSVVAREADSVAGDLQRRATLAAELATMRAEISERGEDLSPRIDQLRSHVAHLDGFLELSRSADSAHNEWTDVREEIEGAAESLKLSGRRLASRQDVTRQLRAAASRLELDLVDDPAQLLESVRTTVEEQVTSLRTQAEALDIAAAATADAWEVARRLGDHHKELATSRRRLLMLTAAEKEVRKMAAEFRTMRDSAARVKASLIEQVFSASLNDLWSDLFFRLAKHEVFFPRMEVSVLSRGQIQTQIMAVHESGVPEPFQHLRSVFSAGNINTAALSLFLSLNLVQTPQNQVLVLDDPVQSMDDVHVMEFASLLRRIVNQLDKQLVVAVHERALFDYLLTELAPAEEGKTLLAIQLERSEEKTVAAAEVHEWSPDALAGSG